MNKEDVLLKEHKLIKDMLATIWDCLEDDSDNYRIALLTNICGIVEMADEVLKMDEPIEANG